LVAVNHRENDACEQHLIKIVTLREIAPVRASIGTAWKLKTNSMTAELRPNTVII
jgi:hypothetical protein